MKKYLIVDGLLHGTGIRDYYEGGSIALESLGLSEELCQKISDWLLRYEEEHYNNFENIHLVNELDKEGGLLNWLTRNFLNLKCLIILPLL